MKFKILAAYSASNVYEEIARFKTFCDESRIKDIRIAGSGKSWVITIVYE